MRIAIAGALVLTTFVAAAEPVPDDGERLARARCSSCHAFIPPDALTQEGWNPGLLHMIARLGLAKDLLSDPAAGLSAEDRRLVLYHLNKMMHLSTPIVPDQPLVSPRDFLAIREYLVGHAPKTPWPQANKTPVQAAGAPFRIGPSVPFDPKVHVVVSLVRIDAARRRVFIGGVKDWSDALQDNPAYLQLVDSSGAVLDERKLDSAPVSLAPLDRDYLLTTIGSLATVQSSKGQLIRLAVKKNRLQPTILLDGLIRAASSELVGRSDGSRLIALNSFGYYLGQLELLRLKGSAVVARTPLLQEPGAMFSRFGDFNADGKLDLLCLFSQHLESILLFDDVEGAASSTVLLRHHPAWGLSSFDLADFNADGKLDLVVSNGDNFDYPDAPLKNYHGVRIYIDTSTAQSGPRYEERWFEPVYGAFKVLARDFDGDGDVDLAVISRYVDEKASPRENFLYFDNRSGPKTIPPRFEVHAMKELEASDFMTMDAGDLDGDGDLDLVLGSTYPLLRPRRRSAEPQLGVVFLINQTEKRVSPRKTSAP
jgi:hypothetical protein